MSTDAIDDLALAYLAVRGKPRTREVIDAERAFRSAVKPGRIGPTLAGRRWWAKNPLGELVLLPVVPTDQFTRTGRSKQAKPRTSRD
jgi:hypothetical protein